MLVIGQVESRGTGRKRERLTAGVFSILSLVRVESLHVVVELLLTRLLKPDLS